MAIIVDKIQKKNDIALSCKTLFLQKGMRNVTISEIAKSAGVGKGTVYEYFKNKEEIVFEIVNTLMEQHNQSKVTKLSNASSTKDKIKIFFSFFYEKQDNELREFYKEFISISLSRNELQTNYMTEFISECATKYLTWFQSIIEEGIQKGEIIKSAMKLSKGLFVLGEGMFLYNQGTSNTENVEKELDLFFDTLFELIEVKK